MLNHQIISFKNGHSLLIYAPINLGFKRVIIIFELQHYMTKKSLLPENTIRKPGLSLFIIKPIILSCSGLHHNML